MLSRLRADLAHSRGETAALQTQLQTALSQLSSIDTMLSSFIVPLQDMAGRGGGRIHCSLNLNTETGRLSSPKLAPWHGARHARTTQGVCTEATAPATRQSRARPAARSVWQWP